MSSLSSILAAYKDRVTARNSSRSPGDPTAGARAIVYWMQRAQRALDNPALDLAIEMGNHLGLPVVAYF